MANVITGNPWIIDTVSAVSITAEIFNLWAVRWVSGSTADVATIQQADGIVKWESIGAAANNVEAQTFKRPIKFNGLLVPTLGAGKVYLYVEKLH